MKQKIKCCDRTKGFDPPVQMPTYMDIVVDATFKYVTEHMWIQII